MFHASFVRRFGAFVTMAAMLGMFSVSVVSAQDEFPTTPDFSEEMPDLQFEEFDFGEGGPSGGPSDAEVGAALAGVAVCYGSMILLALAIWIVIILAFSKAVAVVPQQYREMEPGMVWLLLVPLLNLVWIFMVGIKVPRSFKNYFNAQGRTDVGDCGESLGLWWGITTIIGCSPAALILLIMLLVKLNDLKKQVAAKPAM